LQAKNNQKNSQFIGWDRIRKIACKSGIKAFCHRHGLNPEFGYRLDFLKSLKDKYSSYYLSRV